MKESILELLSHRVILGDGALGTYFYENGVPLSANLDLLNLQDPDLVASAHEDYVRAGSQLIETNTFGANRFKLKGHVEKTVSVEDVVAQGVRIAKKVAGERLYVAGSIGPTGAFPMEEGGEVSKEEVFESFSEVICVLLEEGVDLILLETFGFLEELLLGIRACRKQSADIPLFAQMVFPSRGIAVDGNDAFFCAQKALAEGANGFGSNCGRGVKSMLEAFSLLEPLNGEVPLSAFPNAGLPEIVGHRTIYSAQPSYMASGIAEMIKMGARLVGGCCGTSPQHIAEFKKRLHLKGPSRRASIFVGTKENRVEEKAASNAPGALIRSLPKKRIPILVELDPPTHLDCGDIILGAKELKAAGVDAVTLAENPLAILRTDNLALARLIQEKAGIDTVVHMTCRDRNVLGLQNRIMGAHLLGIKGILAITGDPATASDQPGTSGVFDLDSIGLVRTIQNFNRGINLAGRSVKVKTDFSIGVAFSYRPKNPELQLKRLKRKRDQGAHFVMTQPLFDKGEIESMMELVGDMGLVIFPGIFPLISARNAEFLHNEVPGISVPKSIRDRLWRYEKVEDQRKVAFEMTFNLVESILKIVHGLYIISPLNKWKVAKKLIVHLSLS
ncbi:bifunctional homocysteine S-methyltransferase/methylenetetrahydrofolate reductase [Dissulfuribacter thermophilus]|uniref:Bifunctional homocysteine S-methyltransferase/methylenetetrahydrofolate reductase n=1 Tax=Dissulfuribacter thermophilus TaxID=1156395 RepID=A0A1B9F8M1_9BACT|nr:bifunctional homocysteine S-methyltransferase/methylenetetrahydrofolate reductase [Dissulfuribacter thermophilus]OCC16194.1 bifunctional homocysteine S-methyltransferase/methylenetetrahydrofolate reductase [Dissulfuribacter thermophilus]